MSTKFKKTKFKLLALSASLLACGMGVSGGAQANAYAFAANNLKDGALFAGVDTNGDGRPDTLTSAISFGTPSSESSSSATLNGTGVANSDSTSLPDARKDPLVTPKGAGIAATVGFPVRPNELLLAAGEAIAAPHVGVAAIGDTYYKPYGTLPTNYSWGDARVISEQTLSGVTAVARNAAESNIVPPEGSANADGTNKSSTRLDIPILIGADCGDSLKCAVSFSFQADPYIYASLDALAFPGSVARGSILTSITLNKVGFGTVFLWEPNGFLTPAGGGCGINSPIFGGCETADAESLNLTKEVLLGGDPAAIHSPNYAANGFGFFDAYTAYLGTGVYNLSLVMNEKTDVKRVPEPATLALLGLGLTGLAFARRRKQA